MYRWKDLVNRGPFCPYIHALLHLVFGAANPVPKEDALIHAVVSLSEDREKLLAECARLLSLLPSGVNVDPKLREELERLGRT